jgi:hypothetical protein
MAAEQYFRIAAGWERAEGHRRGGGQDWSLDDRRPACTRGPRVRNGMATEQHSWIGGSGLGAGQRAQAWGRAGLELGGRRPACVQRWAWGVGLAAQA